MEVVQERGEIDEIGEMWNNQRRDNIEKGREERGWDPEWRGESPWEEQGQVSYHNRRMEADADILTNVVVENETVLTILFYQGCMRWGHQLQEGYEDEEIWVILNFILK